MENFNSVAFAAILVYKPEIFILNFKNEEVHEG